MNEIIEKYTNTVSIEDNDSLIFMNDGYIDVDDLGYPKEINNLIFNEKNKHWKYQANLYFNCLKFGGVIPTKQYDTYVDIGCGRGGGINFVQENFNFKNLIGIDITPYNINFCKSWINDAKFICSSALDNKLENNLADVVTCIEVCGYFDLIKEYLNECYRILKPKGILIQASPYLDDINLFISNGFKFVAAKNINYNVNLACSISKTKFKDIDEIIYRQLLDEEKRFDNKKTSYNIMVFQK